ncbi:hypothetical protein CCACVL1_22954 [Corchorus capsularis]|uniref:Uncharacterized protein n=1 Tax=Corchorus capsularis TaxID=210143 RepID=A0A1R3GW53_COCAP|nr:hypothetical protein CCACVL1_22954 [Corchorus capsularis]
MAPSIKARAPFQGARCHSLASTWMSMLVLGLGRQVSARRQVLGAVFMKLWGI